MLASEQQEPDVWKISLFQESREEEARLLGSSEELLNIMWIHRTLLLAALAAVSCGLVAAAPCSLSDINVSSDPFIASGCFNQDADIQSFLFTEGPGQASFSAFTTQWGNSTGFAAVLTLFDATTNQIITSDNTGGDPSLGTCNVTGYPAEKPDPTQYNTCLDAYVHAVLGAGSYRLVLSEWNNYALDTQVPGPFDPTQYSQYGTGNFTSDSNHWALPGTTCAFTGDPGSCFLSPNDSTQRGNNWGIVIAETPEPVTGLLGLSGLLVTLGLARRRRGDRS